MHALAKRRRRRRGCNMIYMSPLRRHVEALRKKSCSGARRHSLMVTSTSVWDIRIEFPFAPAPHRIRNQYVCMVAILWPLRISFRINWIFLTVCGFVLSFSDFAFIHSVLYNFRMCILRVVCLYISLSFIYFYIMCVFLGCLCVSL